MTDEFAEVSDKAIWDTERCSLWNQIERLEKENEELKKKLGYLEGLLLR